MTAPPLDGAKKSDSVIDDKGQRGSSGQLPLDGQGGGGGALETACDVWDAKIRSRTRCDLPLGRFEPHANTLVAFTSSNDRNK